MFRNEVISLDFVIRNHQENLTMARASLRKYRFNYLVYRGTVGTWE